MRAPPSGSDALPDSVADAPVSTVCAAPASAVGAWFCAVTDTVSVSDSPCASETFRLKESASDRAAASDGAAKVGPDAEASLSATVVPLAWRQA